MWRLRRQRLSGRKKEWGRTGERGADERERGERERSGGIEELERRGREEAGDAKTYRQKDTGRQEILPLLSLTVPHIAHLPGRLDDKDR